MSKVHVLTLIHSEGTSLTSAVPALQAALLQAGGHLVMPYLMGDAVVMDSKQVPRGDSASWDFILTRHQSVEAYLAATKSKDYLVALVNAINQSSIFSFSSAQQRHIPKAPLADRERTACQSNACATLINYILGHPLAGR